MANVTVKLAIGNFSIEVSGEAEYVDKKVDELTSRFVASWRQSASAPTNIPPAPQTEAGGKKLSAAEFLKKSSAKSQMDRALMLGYFLERNGMSAFTSTDLAALGTEAKQPFANPSDLVAKLTGRGLMMSAGDKEGKRAYALTASGELYVEGLLEGRQQPS
jgi:hypothetical protein